MAMGESEGGRCLPLAVRFESGHGRAEARVESVKTGQDPLSCDWVFCGKVRFVALRVGVCNVMKSRWKVVNVI